MMKKQKLTLIDTVKKNNYLKQVKSQMENFTSFNY